MEGQSKKDEKPTIIPFSNQPFIQRQTKRHKTIKYTTKTFNPIAFELGDELNYSTGSRRKSELRLDKMELTPLKLCQNNIQEICQKINSNYYKIKSDKKNKKTEFLFKKIQQEINNSDKHQPTIQINQYIYNTVNNNINININQNNNNFGVSHIDIKAYPKTTNQNNNINKEKELLLKKKQKKRNIKKFKVVMNILRFFIRLKLRLINYGSTIRKPLIIKRNELSYFQNKSNLSLAKTKQTNEELTNTSFVSVSKEVKKLPWYIIHCESKILRIWNYFIFLLTIYIVLVLPYRISFNDNVLIRGSKFFWFDMSIEICFVLDFIINCFTSYYEDDGTLEYHFGKIFCKYLGGWMILDIISIFPFYLFEWNTPSNKSSFLIIFRITKFYRLTRITKFYKITQTIECLKDIDSKNPNYSGILKILGFILSTFIICHIFACIWYLIARIESFNPDTWVMRMGLLDEPNVNVYLQSLYFSFTVFLTVGYGDIYAFSKFEVTVMCFWLVFCGIYYSFNLSSLGGVFEGANAKDIEINNATRTLKELSKRNSFPKKLEEKIKNHIIKEMKNKDYNEKGDVKQLLNELTIDLKHQIVLDIYDHKIKTIKLFSQCTKEFVSNFVPLLEPKIYPIHFDIYRIKEMPENIFIILEGIVYNITEDKIPFCEVSAGSYFGDIEILRKTYRETGVTTKTKVHLLLMKKTLIYEELVRNDPIFLVKLIENMIKKYKCITQMKKIIKSIIEIGSRKKYVKFPKEEYERQDKSRWPIMYYSTGLEILMKENEKDSLDNREKNKQLDVLFRSVAYITKENYESVEIEKKQTNMLVNKLRLSINLNRQNSMMPNALEFNKEIKGDRFSIISGKGKQFKSIDELKKKQESLKEENRILSEKLEQLKKEKLIINDDVDDDIKVNNFLRLLSFNRPNDEKKEVQQNEPCIFRQKRISTVKYQSSNKENQIKQNKVNKSF